MKTSSFAVGMLAAGIVLAPAAYAQNSTRNIGANNIGSGNNIGNPNNIGTPGVGNPGPCTYNCYGGGSREEVIGRVIGGIIEGVISGSSRNRGAGNSQPGHQQPVRQQPVQQQPVQQQQVSGLSHAHYEWCIGKYKSYVISSNTYTAFSGETRICNSPHD